MWERRRRRRRQREIVVIALRGVGTCGGVALPGQNVRAPGFLLLPKLEDGLQFSSKARSGKARRLVEVLWMRIMGSVEDG